MIKMTCNHQSNLNSHFPAAYLELHLVEKKYNNAIFEIAFEHMQNNLQFIL